MDSSSPQRVLPKHPQENCSVFSYLTFSWVLPLLLKGRKKVLGLEDLYQPLEQHLATNLGTKLEKSWQKEVNSKQKPSLMRVLFKVFGCQLIIRGILLFIIEMLFKVTTPIFLRGIIRYFGDPDNSSPYVAYLHAAGLIACSLFNVIFSHALMLSNLNIGMKMRISVCSLAFRKSLKLSKTALITTTSGQVVNMLSNDVARFDLIGMFIHYLWIGPIQTLVIGKLMYDEIGWSAISGIFFILLYIPFQFYLGRWMSKLRLRIAKRTDERVRLMNEIIHGIQVIKMYAWEKPFAKIVSMARGREMRAIRYASWIRGILLSFIMFSSRVSIFASLVMFALLGFTLEAQKAFAVTAYFNVLRQGMIILFPQAITLVAETIVSIKRLEKFLLLDEVDCDFQNELKVNKSQSVVSIKTLQDAGIVMEDLYAKWIEDSKEQTLFNINLKIYPSTVVAIIGKVGAGKSSLVQSILGELSVDSGKIEVFGKISFASQAPWLFSSSVRQNILFGLPMDRTRYRAVTKACFLTRDFEIWPDGDKTIVGERGMSMSGGQKARINLARAVYRKADIYLLDDPFSAVDSHVQRHLFENCIKDLLENKIVIFVTHQLQYLPNVDQIVLLENGRVKAVGTYENLRESGLDFTKILPQEDKEEEAEDPKEPQTRFCRTISRLSEFTLYEDLTRDSYQSDTNLHRVQEEEKREVGKISWKHYKAYIKSTGGYGVATFIAFMFIIAQVFASAFDYFLTYWVSKEEERHIAELFIQFNGTLPTIQRIFKRLNDFCGAKLILESLMRDRNSDVYIFSALLIGCVVFTLLTNFLCFNVAINASRKLHDAMFKGITHASMYFFNTNPSGRILNRFSKDIGQIDEVLPMIIVDVLQILLSFLGILFIEELVNPVAIIPTTAIAIIFCYMRSFYLKTSRNIKRMDATTRSPIFSHLSAALSGLPTIRAFNAEENLCREFDSHQDLNSTAFYLFLSTSRAFGFWLDFVLCIYIALIILSFFLVKNSGGNVGLAITQVMALIGMVQWGMRQSAELENSMTAVERVVEYQTIDPEPDFESTPDKKPPKDWPEKGEIKFNKLSLSYFPDMEEKVLKELQFEIKPQEKIGIVGRTGAGKSSIIQALFRLTFLDGTIEIDLRDTQQMGLHDLRSKISIIPQEPVLFSGTMRYNLDPFDEYADDKLWNALEEVNLKVLIKEMPAGLNTKITEGGTNFSVGQRQLVCLARAILRENKILVMDEATANVDLETDALIQKTIRHKFADCTVLTIAHRLNTIMDSDRILVMDAGKCVEFSSPYELLTKAEEPRIFYGMLKETGKATFDMLRKIAEETFNKKKTE